MNGKPLTDLVFIEIFSGTGGLCAEVRKWGLANSVGVDAHISKQTKSPVIRIDLTDSNGVSLLWRMLSQRNVALVHLGPPCGTSSRARDIRPGPQPLRSSKFPEGLPHLRGVSLRRVQAANLLYRLSSEVFLLLQRAWNPLHGREPRAELHVGDKVLCIFEQAPLEISSHPAPLHVWQHQEKVNSSLGDISSSKQVGRQMRWAARACEVGPSSQTSGQQPKRLNIQQGLCQAWSNVMVQILCEHGAVKSASQLSDIGEFTTRQSRAEVGKQPRGNRIPPFVREYKQLIKLTWAAFCITYLKKSLTALGIYLILSVLNPTLFSLPINSKVISAHIRGDTGESAEMCVGVHWEPMEFIDQTHGMGHPKFFLKSIPSELQDAIEFFMQHECSFSGKIQD